MAPQQRRSSPGGSPGDITPRYPGRGTGPLAGVPGGCTTKGCQQHFPPGKCPLVLSSPAAAAAYGNKPRAAFLRGKKHFLLSHGIHNEEHGTGMWAHLWLLSPSLRTLSLAPPCWPHPSHALPAPLSQRLPPVLG